MPFGAECRPDRSTRFRLWAPGIVAVDLELIGHRSIGRLPMHPGEDGWFERIVADARAGLQYRFVLPSGLAVPDPASRRNPQDVHGPSEVVDPLAYAWRTADWAGRPWEEAVLYELHVGTFTPEGTFRSAIERLDSLAELGITALELMPVADFPGSRNWGYDGVLPFAPDTAYGTPDELKALIDRAHELGMMVLLDVVYNHFGPEGNYLHAYAPQFFNPAHQTPWGAAINFDGEHCRTVRDFFIHNALFWVEEYCFDGLRLDAIHAIRDTSSPDIVREIGRALREGPGSRRAVHLVLENDSNIASLLERDGDLEPRYGTAQWNDDIHHALHVLVTGEGDGYYADYADAPLARLGRALAEGFVYQGEPSAFRGGERRGEPSGHLPASAFVSFMQTHDQIGNRAFGERMHALGNRQRERTALACIFLSPQVPMLFMGEEWAASSPFLFFCDFGPELAQAVVEGRRREFAQFAAFGEASARERIPDPGAHATFVASRLDWSERDRGEHRARLALVRELIELRRTHLVPRLRGARGAGRTSIVDGVLRVDWTLGDGSTWRLFAHFGDQQAFLPSAPAGEVIHAQGARRTESGGLQLDPGAVHVQLSRGEAIIPRVTYRLQLHAGFDFDAAARTVPYLARLGVSHVYCSPILRARPGSLHGYDIVAHDQINPELGGREGFDRFTATLRAHGMGQILDVVPNHMGVLGADNAWWMDVLENGQASAHAQFFDIDWHPVDRYHDGQVLVPALGDHYGDILAGPDLLLTFEPEGGSFSVRYHEHRFPLDPCTYPDVLGRAVALLAGDAAAELSRLADDFTRLPSRALVDRPGTDVDALVAARTRDSAGLKERLAQVARQHAGMAAAIDAAVAQFNEPGARDALHALLESQPYRLSYWRVASDEINYRRFFDINDLAALRMEHAQVFEATHACLLDLTASGAVDGLRIDHPDGLFDPAQYFRRLQEGHARRAGIPIPRRGSKGRAARPLYVVIEKITAPHEKLPDAWAVHGTTGYRHAMVLNDVLLEVSARRKFDRIWRSFTDEQSEFGEIAYRSKAAIMRTSLASELTAIATRLLRIARADRRTRDFTFNTLRQALAEAAACMPVYRTYLAGGAPSKQDLRYIDWAIARARRRSRAADTSIFGFVRQSLLGEAVAGASVELQASVRQFAVRFQQFSSPVAAKGVEDTAFYRFFPLASLNEVGGDPEVFGMTVRAFHSATAHRAKRWPHTLLATSTHDNKRSEDVRNRINVLSELPGGWRLALRRWRTMNRTYRSEIDERIAPSPKDEYLLYQTLLGTLPAQRLDEAQLIEYRERMEAYMVKAAREAKENTSWVNPDAAYEAALTGFVRGLLARPQHNLFLDDLHTQVETLSWFGALNSIAMVVLKFTSPGVPDVYQGNELFDLSLVDPDNRRPVDFDRREQLLAELEVLAAGPDVAAAAAALMRQPDDGRAKLWVTWRLLQLRQRCPALFERGHYLPLSVRGPAAAHVVAYARTHQGQRMITISGRLFASLGTGPDRFRTGDGWGRFWSDTRIEIPPSLGLGEGARLADALDGRVLEVTGGALSIAAVLDGFPATVLTASASAGDRPYPDGAPATAGVS